MDTVATTRSLWKSGMLPAITNTKCAGLQSCGTRTALFWCTILITEHTRRRLRFGTSSSAGKPALKIAAALHSHTHLPPAPSPAGGEATEHQLRRARLVAHGVRQVRREP